MSNKISHILKTPTISIVCDELYLYTHVVIGEHIKNHYNVAPNATAGPLFILSCGSRKGQATFLCFYESLDFVQCLQAEKICLIIDTVIHVTT